jgi:hypothetical protein
MKRLLSQQAYMLFYTQQVKMKPRTKPTLAPAPTVLLETAATEEEQQPQQDDNQNDTTEPIPDNDDDDEDDKAALAKAILEVQSKPKQENSAAIIVKHDDKMDDKRSKLDALIEREAAHGKSQLAKDQLLTKATSSSQFFDAVGRWDEADNEEDTGTSMPLEKDRKTLIQQMKTKRKKTDLYDMDYDRGKIKKIKAKQEDKFGKPNLFQIQSDQASEKKNKKLGKKK